MSDFKELKPEKTNWLLAKQGNKERIICISEIEIDIMFAWYENFLEFNLRGKEHSKPAIHRLENGPIGNKLCNLWVMLPEVKIIKGWYDILKNPSEEDKRVYAIIDGALNPKEPPKEEPAKEAAVPQSPQPVQESLKSEDDDSGT